MSTISNSLISDKIISIEPCGVRPTIDISVSGDNLFIANGILTHNSAVGVENPGIETTSESMGLAHTVDAQFAIWCGEDDAQLNIINLGLMKNRFGPNVGHTPLCIDYDTLSLYEEVPPTLDNGMNDLLEATITKTLAQQGIIVDKPPLDL